MTETTETTPSPWTPENVDLLKKLWAEGLSAGQIAGRLSGTTRNSVIGKVHRLGLPPRITRERIQYNPVTATRRLVVRSTSTNQAVKQRAEGWKALPMPTERPRPATLYTLMDRPDNGCMYFYGDPLKDPRGYCDKNREPGIAYCGECARICFDVRAPSERQKVRQEREKVAA